MTFVKRKIDVTFYLTSGTLNPATPGSTSSSDATGLTVSGLRVSAVITRGGTVANPEALIRIYGLTLSQLNQFSTLNKFIKQENQNRILVSAGDASGMPVVFVGNIQESWAEIQPPDAVLTVRAVGNLDSSMKPVPPTSYFGPVDVATVMQDLAARGGYQGPENSLTRSHMISNPYWPGCVKAQIDAAARAGHIDYDIDNGTLAIFEKDGHRNTVIPTIAAPDMIGYPTYTQNGAIISALYNPAVKSGGLIDVQSDITPATGKWRVRGIVHELESEIPGGAWYTRMNCIITLPGDTAP